MYNALASVMMCTCVGVWWVHVCVWRVVGMVCVCVCVVCEKTSSVQYTAASINYYYSQDYMSSTKCICVCALCMLINPLYCYR